MRFRTCRFWICFILILALSGCAEDPAETSCAHDLGRLIPAQSGSFFAEGTVAHYRCSLCDGLFDAMHNPVDTVATPKRSTELILTVNGAPVTLKLTSQEARLIRWETEPMDLAVGDTVSLTDPAGEQLPFTAADAQRIADGTFRSPGLQAVLTLTATPDTLVLSVTDGKYPGTVVQINDEEYPMTQADGSFTFGYAQLSAGDRVGIADNLTGDFYGYDHRSADSLPNSSVMPMAATAWRCAAAISKSPWSFPPDPATAFPLSSPRAASLPKWSVCPARKDSPLPPLLWKQTPKTAKISLPLSVRKDRMCTPP